MIRCLFALAAAAMVVAGPSHAADTEPEERNPVLLMSAVFIAQHKAIACVLAEIEECPTENPEGYIVPTRSKTWGFHYDQTDTIFLSDRCIEEDVSEDTRVFCIAVVVHEIVHWLHDKTGQKLTSCETEAGAWDAFNRYVRLVGHPDLAIKDWRAAYPKCQTTEVPTS